MDSERTGIISEADRVVLRRVISRPSPRRATLGFGISQILLGLIIIAISFTAFAMSTSNRVRNACPYWAGFSVLLTGGVGLIAWKQPSSLAVTFFTFLSAICVILHLVGAVLSGDSGALLNTFKRCTRQSDLISNSCLCCQDSDSCVSPNNSVVFEGISNCGAIRQLLKYLMYMMCGANITACIVSFIATVIGCVYFVRKHTSRRLVLRSQANNTTQDTYYNDFVDPVFIPPSVPPPPYSPPEYTAIANDPVVMERNEFIESLTIGGSLVGSNVMPPPYSTLDWPRERTRQRETPDATSSIIEEPNIQENMDIVCSTDTSSSHSPSPAEEAYLAYCQDDGEENAPLPPQRWDSHHIMGSYSSSLNEQFSNMSLSSLDDRLRRIERHTSLDRSSPDDFRSRRRRRREDRRRVRSSRINSSSSASPELGENREFLDDGDSLAESLQIAALENNERVSQLAEGEELFVADSADRGFFSAILMSSNDHSQSPLTSQRPPPVVLKRSSATQTSLESFVIENLSGSPPRRRSQEASPPSLSRNSNERTRDVQSSNRGSILTSSDIDPGLGSSPPSGVESSPSFSNRRTIDLSKTEPSSSMVPSISGVTAKEHLQAATASSQRAAIEAASKGGSPKKITNPVTHNNRKLSTNSQRTKRLHRLRPRAVCTTSSDDDYMESDRVYPRYLVAKLANGVIKNEVHSQEVINNSNEPNNPSHNSQSPVRFKLRQRRTSDNLKYLRKRTIKSPGNQDNLDYTVENPTRLRPNDRKAARRRRRSESLDFKGMRQAGRKVPLQSRSRRFSQPNYTASDYNPWILRSDVENSVYNLNTNHNNTYGRDLKGANFVHKIEINVEPSKSNDYLDNLKNSDGEQKSLVDVNKDTKKLLSRFLYQSGREISPAVKTALQDIQCMLKRDDRYMAEVIHSAKVMDKIIAENSVSGSIKHPSHNLSNKSPSKQKSARKDLLLFKENSEIGVEPSTDKQTVQHSLPSPLISKEPSRQQIAKSLNVARETIL